jgi:hypothetical protein
LSAKVDPQFTYSGVAAQFINFTGEGMSAPYQFFLQEFYSGSANVSFSLFDSHNQPVSTTSKTPLSVGKYTVEPAKAG